MPYGVLTDIFCIILGGIIGPNLNIKITLSSWAVFSFVRNF